MDLLDVIDELRERLDTIDGLNVPAWGVKRVTPPAAVILLPEVINYNATMQRGFMLFDDLVVAIVAGGNDQRTKVKLLSRYLNGTVTDVLQESGASTFDQATVGDASIRELELNDVTYLAAWFPIKITGPGG